MTLSSPASTVTPSPTDGCADRGERDTVLDEICRLTERLTEVMERETGLLRAVRSKEARDVQTEKVRLIANYERQSELLKHFERGEILTDPLMPELVRLSACLAEATADNEAALESTMKLNRSVMTVIARSAQASAAATMTQSYGSALQARYSRPLPVAVNTAF